MIIRIISKLSNKDIYDLELNDNDLKNKKQESEGMHNGLEYISVYSKSWDRQRKLDDMKMIFKSKTKNFEKKSSQMSQKSQQAIGENEEEYDITDDENDPSIMYNIKSVSEEAQNLLGRLENFDFNIFDLNNIIGRKTLPLISIEIFKSLKYFGSVINEKTFFEYISHINDGYNRSVAYHNVSKIFSKVTLTHFDLFYIFTKQ